MSVNLTLFNLLLRPIEAVIASMSTIIDQESRSQKLFFADFVRKLFFAYLEQVGSLRSLAIELQSNQKCSDLGLAETPFSTLKDGFYRFSSEHFKSLFETVLSSLDLKRIKGLDEIGLFRVIDGSLFPTLMQMSWSEYRKHKNAFKLHLNFELNRMIPTEFLVGSGKSSERDFLLKVVEKGVTYIADRGYASFEIVAKLLKADAYFIFRVKDNLLFEVQKGAGLVSGNLPPCFRCVKDETVIFKNDKERNRVRMIQFEVAASKFKIITNRLDITTLQVIVLYAYRWQTRVVFQVFEADVEGVAFV